MSHVSADTSLADTREDDVPWLSADQLRDWQALMGVLMTLLPALDVQLKRDAGVNVFEYHVLAGLSGAPDRALVLSDLAVLAQGSLSRLSHAVTRLERAGWVERRDCVEPGRRVEARLTDAGMAKLEEVAPGHVREVRRLVVDVLTAAQLSTLGEAARAITAATLAGDPEACRDVSDC
jgi:DNA-binding MarR family transcriptional regulator